MASLGDVLDGVAAAMEKQVPELTTVLHREADVTDNEVRFPHGEIVVVSNVRSDQWNTDLVGYATDNQGNRIGKIFDALFENTELQMNIWLGVPSDDHDIQSLGNTLERGMRKYDDQQHSAALPDGAGGTLSAIGSFNISEGGTLPFENANPPMRGYQVPVILSFTDRINTADEYGDEYYIETVDTANAGDLTDGSDQDAVAIEYNA